MTKKKRIEYLLCTLSVFVTAFVIYGYIGSIEPLINENRLQSFFAFGFGGGFAFSVLASAIILSVNFFKKQGLAFKVISCLLWPVTIFICVYISAFSYIPYQIYNIVKIVNLTKEEKQHNALNDISNENPPDDTTNDNAI